MPMLHTRFIFAIFRVSPSKHFDTCRHHASLSDTNEGACGACRQLSHRLMAECLVSNDFYALAQENLWPTEYQSCWLSPHESPHLAVAERWGASGFFPLLTVSTVQYK